MPDETRPAGSGVLLSVAPKASELGHLLRAAIDAEQVGATRLHLAADQPEPIQTVRALREQTSLVLTAEPGFGAADLVDLAELDEIVLQPDAPQALVARVAEIVAQHPAGVSIGANGAAALPVLLAALAAGADIRVGTADAPAPGEPRGGGRDDAALVARAAGLARIAGRAPLDPAAAQRRLRLV
jgi:hypothetical protein